MPDPLRDSDPREIGPYRLHARLGAGGMGLVYLGSSPGGHTVAVKAVRPELADDPDFRRRFAVEITAARTVGGLYTAQVVDADPDGDPPWLATAYIPGPSLHRAVADRGPLPPDSVSALGAGLAEGLAAVHAQGVVHRDLKPANVILSAQGPRLIDFGIARALDATSHTRTSTVLGTAAFMSPEQARAEKHTGFASDVFSLGCVLGFAATGHSPFGEGPAHAVAYRVVHADPDLEGIPGPLADLVAACLAKEPGDRPRPEDLLRRFPESAPPEPESSGRGWLPDDLTEVIGRHETLLETLVDPGTAPGGPADGGRAPSPPRPRAAPSGAQAPEGAGASSGAKASEGAEASEEARDPQDVPRAFEMTTAATRVVERFSEVRYVVALVAALFVGAVLFGLLFGGPDAGFDEALAFAGDIVTAPLFVLLYSAAAVLALLDGGSAGHDLLIVDDGGIRVVDRRWLRLRDRSFTLAWDRLRSVRAHAARPGSGKGIEVSVTVEFAQGRSPDEAWLKRHGVLGSDQGHTIATTSLSDAADTLYRVREALDRFGGGIHVLP